MVAIIDSGDISELLAFRSLRRGKRKNYTTVAWRQKQWRDVNPHLALLLDERYAIRWIGRAQGRRSSTDLDRRVEVVDIESFTGITFESLRQQLSNDYKGELRLGILSNTVGDAVTRVLTEMYPDWAETISRLSRRDPFHLPPGERGYRLNEERDGTGLLLDIGGIGREALRDLASPEPQQPSFLAGVSNRFISEESLIDYDVGRFPGLVEGLSGHVDWRVFEGNRRQMFIMNANLEPLEETLGADVLYFNETFKSFVLIQYKRLTKERPGAIPSKVCYRPDQHLARELERMRVVDELYGSSGGDFRLFGQACWVKLCNSTARVEDSMELVKGMYLAREHFVELLDKCKGPRGGTRLGYDNVSRYINNTMFTQLVKDGWIGTRDTGTAELEKVVVTVLESRRALVLGFPL